MKAFWIALVIHSIKWFISPHQQEDLLEYIYIYITIYSFWFLFLNENYFFFCIFQIPDSANPVEQYPMIFPFPAWILRSAVIDQIKCLSHKMKKEKIFFEFLIHSLYLFFIFRRNIFFIFHSFSLLFFHFSKKTNLLFHSFSIHLFQRCISFVLFENYLFSEILFHFFIVFFIVFFFVFLLKLECIFLVEIKFPPPFLTWIWINSNLTATQVWLRRETTQ